MGDENQIQLRLPKLIQTDIHKFFVVQVSWCPSGLQERTVNRPNELCARWNVRLQVQEDVREERRGWEALNNFADRNVIK